MIRPILTVSAGTLTSRLLGFVRDALVAALLGAGGVADAFLLAFQLVNVTRRLLTEGALNAALVPAWLRLRDLNGPAVAAAFAGRLVGSIGVATLAMAILLGVAMPLVIAALAPGFVGQPTLQRAVDDARLMLPYLAFAGPVAVMMGLLNAQHRFALTAFSPLLFNLALIGTTIALLIWRRDAAEAALILAATVGVAGLLQLLTLAWRRGDAVATPLRLAFDAEMRGFLGRALPGMLANSGPQWLIVAGAVIASAVPAAVSWLYFANRLIELPLGIVGTAMGTVLVPELTRAVRADDPAAIAQAESRALELAVGLALPAMLGLVVLSQPIVRLLFEHGAFGAADTAATAQALALLALGLPAQVLTKALAPAFFARDNTGSPLRAMLGGLGVAIVAALLLAPWFGIGGVAAAVALGAWGSAALLIRRGAATFGLSLTADARRRLVLIAIAALAMAGLLWLKATFALPLVAQAHSAIQAAALLLVIAGAVAIYGGLLVLLGVVSPSELLRAIRRPAGLHD
ncbi:MAG: murein biosynthesis integral membrane protein MurJ [Rhodopseudomonas sp.]|uniref:murein biosynthesis integral membrane protein MurJ n=1 Tax=Rhodopseudomonas sp. TaxID=1078 RepID=UPI0017E91F7F|nr:murein biosynthesis integral membrane protein MurJ [Rhodopseudomonas sp.]NVN85628.1 murein biosynthesis integral membrane protein MurJ [Rhodopseudomonas sp.]